MQQQQTVFSVCVIVIVRVLHCVLRDYVFVPLQTVQIERIRSLFDGQIWSATQQNNQTNTQCQKFKQKTLWKQSHTNKGSGEPSFHIFTSLSSPAHAHNAHTHEANRERTQRLTACGNQLSGHFANADRIHCRTFCVALICTHNHHNAISSATYERSVLLPSFSPTQTSCNKTLAICLNSNALNCEHID